MHGGHPDGSFSCRHCRLMPRLDILASGHPIMAPRVPHVACRMNTRKKCAGICRAEFLNANEHAMFQWG